MKERRRGMALLFGVLALIVFLFFWFYDEKKRYLWFESFRADSNQPYGAMFIQKMLEDYRGGEFTFNRKPLKLTLEELPEPADASYVFIGQNIFLDEESKSALVRFMDHGGDVFIASLTPPEEILGSVYFQECGTPIALHQNRSDSVILNFYHERLRIPYGVHYAFRFVTEDLPYNWNYFDEAIFCDSTASVVPLAYQEENHVNFIRIATGKGNLYLHSNPLVFTNYFLTRPEGRDYAAGVFSHMDGRHFIWDEYSKVPYFGDGSGYNSPLYYIMQQPSLKYAWWLMLFAVVVYVILAGKRKQQPIPVREEKSNTSLEFVKLISVLHYRNGNHLDMAHKKMKYFLYFVRSKYGIHAERFTSEHIRKLAEKARVSHVQVESIFTQYNLIEERFKNNIEVNRLVSLNEVIDNFYRQCK